MLGPGRDDQRRDPRAGAPEVALGHGLVVPEAAVLVIGHDDQHVLPLRAGLQLGDHAGDVRVAVGHAGIARVLVEVALRLVEAHGRQLAGGGVLQELRVEILQVLRAVGRGGGLGRIELRVVIEGLVVELEVRRGPGEGAVRGGRRQRRVVAARIPGPAHILLVKQVGDGGGRLRGQGSGLARVRGQVARAAGRGVGAGLVGRLHRVDRVELAVAGVVLRGDVVAVHEHRRAGDGGCRRIGRHREARQEVAGGVLVHGRDRTLGDRGVGIGVFRRARAHQVLVVQERAAEGAHEEVVGQHVFLGQLPQLHAAAVVVAHGEAAGVGPGGELVVAAAVDLHLVLEEAVVEIAGDHVRPDLHAGGLEAGRGVDLEGAVVLAGGAAFRHGDRLARCGDAAPDLGQLGEYGARRVAVHLRHVAAGGGRIHAGDAVGTGVEAVEVVETAVFRVNDHDVLDALLQQAVGGGAVAAATGGQQGGRGGGQGEEAKGGFHDGALL